jgi:hypothetical protein
MMFLKTSQARKAALLKVLTREFQTVQLLWENLNEQGYGQLWTDVRVFADRIRQLSVAQKRIVVDLPLLICHSYGQLQYRLAPTSTRHISDVPLKIELQTPNSHTLMAI